MNSNNNDLIKSLIILIESRKKESERFIEKYNTRNMTNLEEYYKGAEWAFDYVLQVLKEQR